MNDYFRNIQDINLRTWNQSVLFFNIREDEGEDASQEYAKGLTKGEKVRVLNLLGDIKKRGYEVVRAELNRNMVLQQEEDE